MITLLFYYMFCGGTLGHQQKQLKRTKAKRLAKRLERWIWLTLLIDIVVVVYYIIFV